MKVNVSITALSFIMSHATRSMTNCFWPDSSAIIGNDPVISPVFLSTAHPAVSPSSVK